MLVARQPAARVYPMSFWLSKHHGFVLVKDDVCVAQGGVVFDECL